MSMSVGSAEDGAMNSEINTTPLVDVMLVLLIIFLITVPVVTQSVRLSLPKESNVPTQPKPENVLLAVTKDGDVYWGTKRYDSTEAFLTELKKVAVLDPQPEVHIRGDENVRYESIGKLIVAIQRAGIAKVGFIIEPPPRN